MSDFREMARDSRHRRSFEKLLLLAARRGDTDLVAQRLSWGIDPNCLTQNHRTPLMVNARGSCPSAATIRVLLQAGADPHFIDNAGLSALDYARRKMARLLARAPFPIAKSSALDENNQLQMNAAEQKHYDMMRMQFGHAAGGKELLRLWWQERLRAARRVFNDPREVEQSIELLERATN